MKKENMFTGLNSQEWEDALKEQNKYLQENYGYSIDTSAINADDMNEKAREAAGFMSFMAKSLKDGISANDETIRSAVETHIKFMQQYMDIDAKGFAVQSRFLMTDSFHRNMMEQQQIGLSYYICFAAENFAAC